MTFTEYRDILQPSDPTQPLQALGQVVTTSSISYHLTQPDSSSLTQTLANLCATIF